MSVIVDPTLTPEDLGLPSGRFPSFRPAQIDAIEYAMYGPHPHLGQGPRPFMLAGLPTGIGKSVLAQAIGNMSGVKFAVLTATKALEDQAADHFCGAGKTPLINIRGKGNYRCKEPHLEYGSPDLHTGLAPIIGRRDQSCDEGMESGCEHGTCKLEEGETPECPYRRQYMNAKYAPSILTNYSYWLHARTRRGALETQNNPIQLLVLDELHLALNSLGSFLGIWVGDRDLKKYVGESVRECLREGQGTAWGRVSASWVRMLSRLYDEADGRMLAIAAGLGGDTQARRRSGEYRHLSKLQTNLERVILHGADNNWIWRQVMRPGPGIEFDCIWPGRYARQYLWSGVERVVGLSATLRPKHAELLYLSNSMYYFKEWPRQFPAKLNPVWWVPTGKMGMKTGEREWKDAVDRHDQIVDAWGEYKGLVHTGSYDRARRLKESSRHGKRMIVPGKDVGDLTAQQAIDKHIQSIEPTTLVGPVFTTGVDLADDACRWIHWLKLPYPDRSDPIVVARAESDPEWYDCETMQAFQQGCGRGTRHDKDWCVVIVTDDAIGRFRNYARRFASSWFRVEEWKGRTPVPLPLDLKI